VLDQFIGEIQKNVQFHFLALQFLGA